jgi:hypothetical protein
MFLWSVVACVLVAGFLKWTGWSWLGVVGLGALLLSLVALAYFLLVSSGIDVRALDRRED